MAATMTPDIREGAATMTRGFRVHKKNKMAAPMTPDIREGAATMTRGLRENKKTRWHLTSEFAKKDGSKYDTWRQSWRPQ